MINHNFETNQESRDFSEETEAFCMEAEERLREGCRATIEACFSLKHMSSILQEEFQKWPYVKNEESSENNITQSNYQMLKKLLEGFHPERPGISSAAEVKLIKQTLCIPAMDLIALQNLRDFTVMFLSQRYDRDTEKNRETLDIMSAITGVIDSEKIRKGGSV